MDSSTDTNHEYGVIMIYFSITIIRRWSNNYCATQKKQNHEDKTLRWYNNWMEDKLESAKIGTASVALYILVNNSGR
jgi:hypothetical protein